MLETTFQLDRLATATDCTITTNVADAEIAQQAELVGFAYYATRVISLTGPARAGLVIDALTKRLDGAPQLPAATIRVVARFIDGASGPRMFFRIKGEPTTDAGASVAALRGALASRWQRHAAYASRLDLTAELVGRLGATGQIRKANEFDVALAAADVGWRLAVGEDVAVGLDCPACRGARGQPRLWPSETAVLCRCARCGSGCWARDAHAPRLLRQDLWAAMESLRAELADVAQPEAAAAGVGRPLLDELKRVFTEFGWPYLEVRGAPVLLGSFAGPRGTWRFYAQVVEDQDLILLYSICPHRVPEPRRREMSEFLARANYGLAAGNFELDFDDGEVRYKTALHVQGEDLDGLAVKRLVRANGVAMETYLPEITSVIEGETRVITDS